MEKAQGERTSEEVIERKLLGEGFRCWRLAAGKSQSIEKEKRENHKSDGV